MHERLQSYFINNTTDYWVDALSEAHIPAGPANALEDLQDEPQLKGTNFFQKRKHPTEGDYWETQPPVRFANSAEKEIQPAPHIGEHTDSVLKELGMEPQAKEGKNANS